jgi:hypothetical protein
MNSRPQRQDDEIMEESAQVHGRVKPTVGWIGCVLIGLEELKDGR